jgi:hypothetical protein
VGHLCHAELEVLREVLRVDCPFFFLVWDLERVPGFRELVKGVPEKWRHRRVGVSFPLAPDLDPSAVPGMIEQGMDWVGNTLFPALVYKLFHLGPPATASGPPSDNSLLYQLLVAIRERQRPLAGLLLRALGPQKRAAPLLGGCYFGGIGQDPARDSAFVPGVFPLLVENQNFVSWTESARAEEASFRRWTAAGYLGLVVLAAALSALVYQFWPRG